MSNRRNFLKKSALFGLGTLASQLNAQSSVLTNLLQGDSETLLLPALPYAANALEPCIDEQTMLIHHGKHHQAYIDKLKTVPADQFDAKRSLAESCALITASSTTLLRNNLGGHFNHSLFWTLLKPNPEQKENKPSGALAEAIQKKFGSLEIFTKEFSEKALKVFGSGWCWLILTKDRELKIVTTANQDNPLMPVANDIGSPLLALDVWEHAYYLKYQNKRAEYISNWWKIVNWEKAEELYTKAK